MGGSELLFIPGLLYAIAFFAAYFVITKYDAFPTAFFDTGNYLSPSMGKPLEGYATSIIRSSLRFFHNRAPFFVFFNAKGRSLKLELISAAKIVVPIFVIVLFTLCF